MNKPQFLIIHHFGGTEANPKTDTSGHTFGVVNEWHRQLWSFKSSLGYYCGYHYVIEKDGKVTQARADNETGAHCIGYNQRSIGIALAGNFDVTDPTEAQVKALRSLLVKLSEAYAIPFANIVPHRIFAPYKSCYGTRLKDSWARSLISDFIEKKYYFSTQIELYKSKLLDLYRFYTTDYSDIVSALSDVESREA